VAYVPPFEATALGLVSYLDGAAALGDGTVVGQVVVGFADGVTRTFTLRAGVGTELEFVIMVIAVSCVKLLSAHNSTQHTSRKHKV
jgi:hypothetical protein